MNKIIKIFVLTFLLNSVSLCIASNPEKDEYKKPDNFIYSIDSSLHGFSNKNFAKDFLKPNISDTIQYPTEIYKIRIANLSGSMIIPLEYNEFVQKYIDAYSIQNKTKLNRIYALSKYYFPLFEDYLIKYNLPLELKYLSAIESALDVNAISVSGATGLWQFVKSTSDVMGLKVNSYIDERRDPFMSTEAACKYLEYLYRTFEDWHLALAAYNGGPGAVKKAILRAGGNTNYWEIRKYMSEQMQNYVPAFIAMAYLLNHTEEHQVKEAGAIYSFYDIDTIHVSGPINLANLANELNFSFEDIKFLNPMFYKNFIPDDGNTYPLVLPHSKATAFLVKQIGGQLTDSIKIFDYSAQKKNIEKVQKLHAVERGESLHKIAMKYSCTVKDILEWNGLQENHNLLFGEKLIIFVDK
ncbi:MAG: transglycosylase SLT domain-containing protein [Bacteroidales bacterium]|nr:transglycosylase SLT domain-containing protein [Bacteroidales bacterium]